MAKKSEGQRDSAKERYWRQMLGLLNESGLSQAQFCKEHNLNAHTLSSWKYTIRDRDKELASKTSSKQRTSPKFTKIDSSEPAPESAHVSLPEARASASTITAELINAETGTKLRIFSGADQATLAAVLAVWSGG